jgi:hypothetical protein
LIPPTELATWVGELDAESDSADQGLSPVWCSLGLSTSLRSNLLGFSVSVMLLLLFVIVHYPQRRSLLYCLFLCPWRQSPLSETTLRAPFSS